MTDQEKLQKIAEVVLDVKVDDISEQTVLSTLEEWDSLAVLSFISIMNDEFEKFPNGNEIRQFKTVKDLMDIMK